MLTELALGTDALDSTAAVAAFVHNAQERGFVRTTEIDALQRDDSHTKQAVGIDFAEVTHPIVIGAARLRGDLRVLDIAP